MRVVSCSKGWGEGETLSIDSPMPSIIARGHADGNQGDWRLVAEEGELVSSSPLSLSWQVSR